MTNPSIDFRNNTIQSLKQFGFKGFISIEELIMNKVLIPEVRGVYIIYQEKPQPKFVEKGTGGFFKGKDPNVSVETLNENWVEDSQVLYIGKAGSDIGNATLRTRLNQYFQFGQGKNVGHWGGRFIWQLQQPTQLKVCWLETLNHEPREVEKALLLFYIFEFEKRPFANLKG